MPEELWEELREAVVEVQRIRPGHPLLYEAQAARYNASVTPTYLRQLIAQLRRIR